MNDDIKEILYNLKVHNALADEEDTMLLNYITNLQQENQELKSKLECYENGVYFSSKVDELERENERLKETNLRINSDLKVGKQDRIEYSNELEDYKSRCEKAVEYLDRHKIELSHSFDEPDCDYWIATNPQDIIDILNGKE